MSAEDAVRDYYDALRRGDPLFPFFVDDESTVKFGISESLFGGEAVGDALREQTETTEDWTVESHRLTVDERDDLAWFADDVTLEWTVSGDGDDTDGENAGDDDHHSFETRWSGTLTREGQSLGQAQDRGAEWLFQSMHVSAPQEL
ncbi:nuclear transport factor 2 family protein [Natronoglomus mannanivorans]|uniref:Nuclear transport factor 2 family protein n=1 Tax=Natronoglomus mannanivorans TaxID=2979990 RepID=A0AAP2YVX4_9EURY|nr:nuclear transport factor 2 family protein [Halobacteria archaeon AArc-xg1-1]